MSELDPTQLAAILGAFERLILPFAILSVLGTWVIIVLGLYHAIETYPAWRRYARPFELICSPAFAILVLACLLMVAANPHVPVRWPLIVPDVIFGRLEGFLLILPGAMACLVIRRRVAAFLHPDPGIGIHEPLRRRALRRDANAQALRHGLIWGLICTAYAFALFGKLNIARHPSLKYFNESLTDYPAMAVMYFLGGHLFLGVVVEEMLWRLVGQTALILVLRRVMGLRAATWLAIVVTSLFWTWSHPENFQFAWAKFAQIFPLGLMIGWVMERHGFASATFAHLVHNAFAFLYGVMHDTYAPEYDTSTIDDGPTLRIPRPSAD